MALLETLFYSIHFELTFLIPRLIVLGGYVRFPTYVRGSCKLRLAHPQKVFHSVLNTHNASSTERNH